MSWLTFLLLGILIGIAAASVWRRAEMKTSIHLRLKRKDDDDDRRQLPPERDGAKDEGDEAEDEGRKQLPPESRR